MKGWSARHPVHPCLEGGGWDLQFQDQDPPVGTKTQGENNQDCDKHPVTLGTGRTTPWVPARKPSDAGMTTGMMLQAGRSCSWPPQHKCAGGAPSFRIPGHSVR